MQAPRLDNAARRRDQRCGGLGRQRSGRAIAAAVLGGAMSAAAAAGGAGPCAALETVWAAALAALHPADPDATVTISQLYQGSITALQM